VCLDWWCTLHFSTFLLCSSSVCRPCFIPAVCVVDVLLHIASVRLSGQHWGVFLYYSPTCRLGKTYCQLSACPMCFPQRGGMLQNSGLFQYWNVFIGYIHATICSTGAYWQVIIVTISTHQFMCGGMVPPLQKTTIHIPLYTLLSYDFTAERKNPSPIPNPHHFHRHKLSFCSFTHCTFAT